MARRRWLLDDVGEVPRRRYAIGGDQRPAARRRREERPRAVLADVPGAPWPAVIAHRGASAHAPEHTRRAYEIALAQGVDGVECDIRLTADGVLVCHHDRRLERTSTGRGAVSAIGFDTMARMDFGGGAGPLLLDELLGLVRDAGRPVDVAIETKHPTRYAGSVEQELRVLLRRHALDRPRADGSYAVRVMSFSPTSLMRVHSNLPGLPTVLLLRTLPPPFRQGWRPRRVPVLGPGLAALRMHPDFVAAAHRAGARVHVWTVDDAQDIEFAINLGVDAIISNVPDRVLARLGRTDGRRGG